MTLWLLRHGQAQASARSDAERELTEQGRDEVRQALEHLRAQCPSVILASPYTRAQQTAAIVNQGLGLSDRLRTVSWLTPDSDPRESLVQLQRLEERDVLLVSHQPFIGALGGLLVHGQRQRALPMHTASLAVLQGDEVLAGLMTLQALTHPI